MPQHPTTSLRVPPQFLERADALANALNAERPYYRRAETRSSVLIEAMARGLEQLEGKTPAPAKRRSP